MPIIKDFASEKQPTQKDTGNPSSLNSTQEKKSGLVDTLGSLLPFAPLVYEHFTGKKLPPMTGTLAEMNSTLSQLALTLQSVINNQNQIYQTLQQLQTSASHLTSQISQIQSVRLTHSKEQRQIEYNPNQEVE